MGTLYIDTGGSATNSGSSDGNSSDVNGTTAVAVGAVVTLGVAPNLSGLIKTPGPTQSSIYITGATNTNRKIFWVIDFDDTAKTVTLDVAPTGSLSTWWIGGRHLLTIAAIEGALRAGDTAIFNNSPASASAALWTFRTAGDSTSGPAKIKGKVGTRPVLTNTSTGTCVSYNTLFNVWVENLELAQNGASGNVVNMAATNETLYNVKISDGGAIGAAPATTAFSRIIGCEITGVLTDGITASVNGAFIGNYIHDVPGDGIEISSTSPTSVVLNNVIDTCAARGIYFSGAVGAANAHSALIAGNTVYGCGDSGIEITDADTNPILINNIVSDNGNAAGESNIEWVAGAAEMVGFHAWNVVYNSGTGADAPINFTVNAIVASSEFTTDPLFGGAAGGDFTLKAGSPARGAGFPGQFLGGSLGYLDIGAVQARGFLAPIFGRLTVI